MSVSVDMFFAPRPRGGYTIYSIGRGGSVSVVGTHYPWFAVFAKAGTADSLAKLLVNSFDEVVDARPYDISELVPILPSFPFRAEPVYTHQVIRVYTARKEQVRPLAERVQRAFSVMAGVYNVTYEVRAAFDTDMKFFHEKTPILFAPNDELEALAEEVIGRVSGLKVMAFDIEVHTRPGRFPTPGDKLLSIQYGVARLDDPDFYSPEWPRDNIVHLVSDRVSSGESRRLAEEFLRAIERERPDVIVGYNSVDFDAKYLEPFLPSPAKEELRRDRFHFKMGNLAFPHIDLMRMRKSMGSSLGIRSQRVMALDDVTREAARKVKPLSWLWGSGLMEAEERLDHTKLVSEWRKRSRLFYDYITADVYLTLILARLWLPTLFLLSALVQVPPTTLTLLNTGQVSEYNMIHFLEKLGFEPYLAKRTREFKKAREVPEVVKRLVPPEWAELYKRGKVYMKTYGLYEYIVEGDFAQLYPTIMANFSLDPTAIRATAELAIEETGRIRRIRDPVTAFGRRLYGDRRAYPALGVRPAKNADHMRITDVYEVVPTYGPISFLLYKMYSMRKITKKIKKKAKDTGRLELLAADQAVKILNNASYGAMSKRRGFINQVVASLIFWVSLKILYDVIRYAEEELGLEVLYGDSVAADTKVIARGWVDEEEYVDGEEVPISTLFKRVDVRVGEKEYYFPRDLYVLTYDWRRNEILFKRVKYVMRHRTRKKMYRIWFTNQHYIDVTEDHSLIGYVNVLERRKYGKEFVEVKPAEIGRKAKSLLMMKRWPRERVESRNYPRVVYEFLGLFVGNGTRVGKAKLRGGEKWYYFGLSLGNDYEELVPLLEEMKRLGWIRNWMRKNGKGDVVFWGGKFVEIAEELYDEKGKIVPRFMLRESEENIAAFLRGLFTADGTVIRRPSGPIVRFTSVRREVVEDVQRLLLYIGIASDYFRESKPNVYRDKSGRVYGGKTYSYHLVVKNWRDFRGKVGFLVRRRNERLEFGKGNRSFYKWGKEVVLVRPTRIEEIKYEDYVYDIEVEDMHVFFANKVLVHNTDSVFIKCREDEAARLTGEEDTMEACSKWFEEHILPRLNEYVRRRYGKEFTIEFEDKFGFCVYPKSKHEAAPSKKSYICGVKEGGRYKVTLFKGDFYKALAPQAIRERLEEFYEEVINRESISESEVEKILRRFLEEAPIPKLFVKKTVDELVKRDEEQEASESRGTVVVKRLKRLNKTWHYAALHLAYVYGLPGVDELQKASTKNVTSVVYRVDADTVLDTGNIIPYFIPRSRPEEYIVYIEDNGELARVHSVVTRQVETEAEQTGPKEKREKWYVVSEMFAERWLTKEELVDMATTYMRKYIIDDVVSKLAPAVVKSKAGPRGSLDAYIYGKGKKAEGERGARA